MAPAPCFDFRFRAGNHFGVNSSRCTPPRAAASSPPHLQRLSFEFCISPTPQPPPSGALSAGSFEINMPQKQTNNPGEREVQEVQEATQRQSQSESESKSEQESRGGGSGREEPQSKQRVRQTAGQTEPGLH